MKRVFIIHGWEAGPEMHWFPWLKEKLEGQGFAVTAPAMPNTMEPKIKEWLKELARVVGKSDGQTYFVGHSIGCQTILRYLAKGRQVQAGGAVLVAPWFRLINLETEETEKIARPWLETPLDFNKVKRATTKIVGIFSNNDPYVPLINSEILKKKLEAEIIIVPNAGHFNFEDGVSQLPAALNAVLKIVRK